MANEQNLKPFKKGQSGNPSGRPKLSFDLKQIRKFTKDEIYAVMHKYLSMNTEEIKASLNKKDTPALELLIGKIIIEGIKKGDQSKLLFLLDRLIGKVTEKIEATGNLHAALVKSLKNLDN